MAVKFDIEGEFEIPRTRRPGAWTIERENILAFWENCEHLANRVGCYIFGIRAGRGIIPCYVGKSACGFRQEVFTPHKLVHYHREIASTRKGTPVMFFAVAEISRGRVNGRAIEECERELIGLAIRTNPDLANTRSTGGPQFYIPHVTQAARGRKSEPTLQFLRTMGLEPAHTREPSEAKAEATTHTDNSDLAFGEAAASPPVAVMSA